MLYPLSYWGILNSAILQCTGWFVKKLEYRRRTNNRLGLRGEGMRNEVLRMLPQTVQIALTGIPDAQIEELRLRVGQKPAVLYAGGERPLSVRTVLLQKELQQTLLNASAQSQYAVQEQLRSGYLSLSGGYRLGVCGSAVVQNGCMTELREISSLAPRSARHPATARAAASISTGILSACRCARQRKNDAAAQLHPGTFGKQAARGRRGRAAGAGRSGARRTAV